MLPFKIEQAAIDDGTVIGWRLTIANDSYLIWADQSIMAGLRINSDGKGFVPRLGESIQYSQLKLTRD